MNKDPLEFRFYYFTNSYETTVEFYRDILQLEIVRHWDRDELDKGTIFKSPNGNGWIEIEKGEEMPLLGGGLYIEVEDIDYWYQLALNNKIQILQPLKDTSYGHRSFKFADPNGMSIGLFKYLR